VLWLDKTNCNVAFFLHGSRVVEMLVCTAFLTFFLPVAVFADEEDAADHSFFSEIVSSVSDVRFSHSGMYMATRDYMSVKVWDVRMESHAVEVYSVHDYLRSKLCTLYENESIYDKFECIWSSNDRLVSPLAVSVDRFFHKFPRFHSVS